MNSNNLDDRNNRKVVDIILPHLEKGGNKRYGYSNKDGERRRNNKGQRKYDNDNSANQEDRRQSKRKRERKRGNGFFGNSNSSMDYKPNFLNIAIITVVLMIFQVVEDSVHK